MALECRDFLTKILKLNQNDKKQKKINKQHTKPKMKENVKSVKNEWAQTASFAVPAFATWSEKNVYTSNILPFANDKYSPGIRLKSGNFPHQVLRFMSVDVYAFCIKYRFVVCLCACAPIYHYHDKFYIYIYVSKFGSRLRTHLRTRWASPLTCMNTCYRLFPIVTFHSFDSGHISSNTNLSCSIYWDPTQPK